jgi:hypothetical protein
MITPRPIGVLLADPSDVAAGTSSSSSDQERPLLLRPYLELLDRDLASVSSSGARTYPMNFAGDA